MRLTLIQMNSRTAARDENVERACGFIDQAAEAGSDLVVLPEFFNNEYFPQFRDARYMEYAETEDGYTQSRIRELARRHGLFVLSTIFEMARPGLYYDTALLSLEKIYFRGGSSFPVFRLEEWTLGVSTCYDNLFPESCRCLALHGAELILAPYATPLGDPWENFLSTRALENGVYFAACNHVGREGEWDMSGKSMVIDPHGKIMSQASPVEEQLLTVEIDRADVIDARRKFPLFRDGRPDSYTAITSATEALHS